MYVFMCVPIITFWPPHRNHFRSKLTYIPVVVVNGLGLDIFN